ncbi:MAG: thioredoxin domain-containing protein [Blastocatellia bacterium]
MLTKRRWRPGTAILFFALASGIAAVAVGQTPRSAQSPSAPDDPLNIVAIVNGQRSITQRDIDELIGPQLYSLQDRLYSLRKNAIENLLVKILLEEEAKVRGVTVEQLKQQLMPERVEITQGKIDQVYAESAGSLGNMSEEEARQRIRIDLESQERIERYKAAIAGLRSKAKVEVLLIEPMPPIVKISDSGPSKGPKNAPVTIVEFSDFQCPYCKQAALTLKQVLQSYGENVRLIFKHTPLPIHAEAFKAAQAAACAAEQGAFWEYHDRLFGSGDLSPETLRKYAIEARLEMKAFNLCLDSEASRVAVLKDMQEARQADVQGTPTFVINGRVLIRGVKGPDEFKKIIDQEIERARATKAKVAAGGL